jgi:hypothetical protein
MLKLSTDWARVELFSAKIVWLFSFIQLLSATGFTLWGRTAMAKAFIIPFFVSAAFLIAIGIGLYTANKPRIAQFEKEYKTNATSFAKKEIERTKKSDGELRLVFKILPAIIILSSFCLMLFGSSNWRAICATLILASAFLMTVDSNTSARNAAYHEELLKNTTQ